MNAHQMRLLVQIQKSEVEVRINQSFLSYERINENILNVYLGSCLSANFCSHLQGHPFGPCAQGFGVCCVFIITTDSGNMVNVGQKVTHLRNPSFPQPDSEDVSHVVRLVPRDLDVVQLRLDFNVFVVYGLISY